ncbi:hypothetical protein [Phenylobacterium sp. J367]|uniref:hypothetical protein n=1 Tax=Phenylobacterium sp. J367 TaxID=2898435 RepID=UPI002150BD4C|nr:hypothetical protein [Phenylobacterium sp. J367]MCR5876925.1 hypothetical protein [Phenylobacterium sp. J367]MCR5876994.1 hypothetical protein [Phenylobacterium sp. J367]
MSIRSARLFLDGGLPAPLLLAQWRAKGAERALQARTPLVSAGLATNEFRSVWAVAFPARQPLPSGPLANRDGTGTDLFWEAFT